MSARIAALACVHEACLRDALAADRAIYGGDDAMSHDEALAVPDEWKVFKAALARWVADQEGEVERGEDQLSVEQEHDEDA